MYDQKPIAALENAWAADPRWQRIRRSYTAEDVVRLRGSIQVEHTLARMGADKLWRLLHTVPFLRALGALTGNQAIQQVQAGLKAIYVSGWQIAGDANTAGHVYPDHSLYPADGAPSLIRRINNALMRADQIQHMEGRNDIDWFAPIVADAEAGFGGTLNTFELVKAMIEAGAAGVHLSGTELAIAHAVAFAPYADMLWCETSTPDLGVAREFAQGVHAQYPGKLLAYNCLRWTPKSRHNLVKK
jgi:isocitrate lyase